jgi:hypothetical protein
VIVLPETPAVSAAWRARLGALLDATCAAPPADLAAIVCDDLGIDCSTRHAGVDIPHPFGKASGQLSQTLQQVEADIDAGVAFIVLKTVIAEDETGERSMADWAVAETQMRVERRTSASGRDGWTVTGRGRGWPGSLDDYVAFFPAALDRARANDVPVIPSVKYHVPEDAGALHAPEYEHTTQCLMRAWAQAGCGGDMILEKDLSPTLAGDARAGTEQHVLSWLDRLPGFIDRAAHGKIRLGVKLMNALFDDRFQVEMMRVLMQRATPAPAFLVVFNRLYDPKLGVAYGGWDLSDRNLRVLDMARRVMTVLPPLSATGNICSGRMMLEYAVRGCESGQLHTFFQLPLTEYTATAGSRSARALHTLLLHPTEGLAVWLRHIHETGGLDAPGGCVRFRDLVRGARGESA